MSFDTIMAILSLAISVGGFISLFIYSKKKIILVTVLSILVLLSAIEIYNIISHQQEIKYVSRQIVECISENGGRSTIEELKLCINFKYLSDLFESIDKLLRLNEVQYQIITVYDTNRISYQIGVYELVQ